MAIEFLLTISMLIVVFLLMLQYAVKAHAHRIAADAAERGLAAAATYDGTEREGRLAAQHVLGHIEPGLDDSSVAVTRHARTATMTVTGHVIQLIPFLPVDVRVHVEGPVERIVGTAGGPS